MSEMSSVMHGLTVGAIPTFSKCCFTFEYFQDGMNLTLGRYYQP